MLLNVLMKIHERQNVSLPKIRALSVGKRDNAGHLFWELFGVMYSNCLQIPPTAGGNGVKQFRGD